jgi:hypothetical protein
MYEVIDSSLSDIKYALDPSYDAEEVKMLDKRSTLASDIMGVKYLPGECRRGDECVDPTAVSAALLVSTLLHCLCRPHCYVYRV